MHGFGFPNLATLDKPRSWCKRSGAIDRSACVVVTVRQVRELAGCKVYRPARKWPHAAKRIGVRPLPWEREAEHPLGRLATGLYFMTAERLAWLHNHQNPRQLAGDWRTTRAQAMRDERYTPVGQRHKNRYTRLRTAIPYADFALMGNPNKGASRTKRLGLWGEWYQPLRIEKWEPQSPVGKPKYWLVCAGHPGVKGSLRHGVVVNDEPVKRRKDEFARPWIEDEQGHEADAWKLAASDSRFPPLSTAKSGAKRTGCPQRVLKLYMVMCTAEEAQDAEVAQRWIDSIPQGMRVKRRTEIDRLMARYGILFWPRALMCRQCLRLRYGTHPDRGREGWHRRRAQKQGKEVPAWCRARHEKKVDLMKRRWKNRWRRAG